MSLAGSQYTLSELIDWVNQRISSSPYNIVITNLTTCFNDGITLCAILHSYYPGPIPFDDLIPSSKKFNIELAMIEAENVGIPAGSTISQDIWLTRSPEQSKIASLISLWRRYLEMEGDDVKNDLEEKCDVLKAKFNDQEQRKRGYQQEIQDLKDCLADKQQYSPCKRCGDYIVLDSDPYERVNDVEGILYHSECHRCFNCSSNSKDFDWYQSELWCNSCKHLAEEQLGSGSAAAEVEHRLLEIKQIEAVRKEKSVNPFREMERKREEERKRKMELFKKHQQERLKKQEEELSEIHNVQKEQKEKVDPDKQNEKEKEIALEQERLKKEQEENKKKHREAEEKRREEAILSEKNDFDQLKQKRGVELEEIKAARAGANPFKEMERQAEEERRKKIFRYSTSQPPKSNSSSPSRVSEISSSKRVSSNPFAEMEKKRQQEKLARLKRFASARASPEKEVEKTKVEPKQEKSTQEKETEETAVEVPSETAVEVCERKELEPEPGQVIIGETSITDKKEEEQFHPEETLEKINSEESHEGKEEVKDSTEPAAEETTPHTIEVTSESVEKKIEEEVQEAVSEQNIPSVHDACEELLDVAEEIELLAEAANIVEAQTDIIQEQLAVIREQDDLLMRQKETIVRLERELANYRESSNQSTAKAT